MLGQGPAAFSTNAEIRWKRKSDFNNCGRGPPIAPSSPAWSSHFSKKSIKMFNSSEPAKASNIPEQSASATLLSKQPKLERSTPRLNSEEAGI